MPEPGTMKLGVAMLLTVSAGLNALHAEAPLRIFDQPKYSGAKASVATHTIHRGSNIPGGLNKKISSLILKKGYQVCIAAREDGTGPSKVLIANKRDIRIPELSEPFNDKIQFIRVLPFRNSVKKGIAGLMYKGLNAGWYYVWGGMRAAEDGIQWVPQTQQANHTKEAFVNYIINTKGVTNVTSFNEPSQKRIVNIPSDAVKLAKNVLASGLRNGSVNPTEHGPLKKFNPITDRRNVSKKGWFREYFAEAKKQGLRLDFMCVHWYDYTWTKTKKGQDRTNPEKTFKRFKDYMTKVYQTYGLPIWITEFCLDTTDDAEEQLGFLKLALPWLESCPFIERYAYYQPNNGSGYMHEGEFRKHRKGKTGDVAKWLEAKKKWAKEKGLPAKMPPAEQMKFEAVHPYFYYTTTLLSGYKSNSSNWL